LTMNTTIMKNIPKTITMIVMMNSRERIEIVDIIIQVVSADLIDLIEDLDIMILYL
jgi:hypothetical protein